MGKFSDAMKAAGAYTSPTLDESPPANMQEGQDREAIKQEAFAGYPGPGGRKLTAAEQAPANRTAVQLLGPLAAGFLGGPAAGVGADVAIGAAYDRKPGSGMTGYWKALLERAKDSLPGAGGLGGGVEGAAGATKLASRFLPPGPLRTAATVLGALGGAAAGSTAGGVGKRGVEALEGDGSAGAMVNPGAMGNDAASGVRQEVTGQALALPFRAIRGAVAARGTAPIDSAPATTGFEPLSTGALTDLAERVQPGALIARPYSALGRFGAGTGRTPATLEGENAGRVVNEGLAAKYRPLASAADAGAQAEAAAPFFRGQLQRGVPEIVAKRNAAAVAVRKAFMSPDAADAANGVTNGVTLPGKPTPAEVADLLARFKATQPGSTVAPVAAGPLAAASVASRTPPPMNQNPTVPQPLRRQPPPGGAGDSWTLPPLVPQAPVVKRAPPAPTAPTADTIQAAVENPSAYPQVANDRGAMNAIKGGLADAYARQGVSGDAYKKALEAIAAGKAAGVTGANPHELAQDADFFRGRGLTNKVTGESYRYDHSGAAASVLGAARHGLVEPVARAMGAEDAALREPGYLLGLEQLKRGIVPPNMSELTTPPSSTAATIYNAMTRGLDTEAAKRLLGYFTAAPQGPKDNSGTGR